MLLRKLTLCAGAGVLWALATPFNTTWMATLSSVGGSNVTGTATVDVSDAAAPSMNKPSMQKPDTTNLPGDPGDTAKAGGGSWAAVSINGAPPGEYPWKIGTGRCGTEAMSVSSEGAYPPIKVDAEGRGTARANVSFQPKVGAEYSVSVLKSKSDRAVIACGKLEPSGQTTSPTARDTTAPKP
jgi:hypothetical protein